MMSETLVSCQTIQDEGDNTAKNQDSKGKKKAAYKIFKKKNKIKFKNSELDNEGRPIYKIGGIDLAK